MTYRAAEDIDLIQRYLAGDVSAFDPKSGKRIWRMKGKHYWRHGGYRPRFRVKHGFRKHGHYLGHSHHSRRHHRHVEHVYPVYDDTPAHSLGLDIETKDFRFSVNKSG